MSDSPFALRRPTSSTSKPIPPLSSDTTSTPSSSSSFPSLKTSSVSRKKPMGLNIAKSIRPAPSPPLDGSSSAGSAPFRRGWTSEADKLRQDIERLQLSSGSSSSRDEGDSPPQTPTTNPTTPTTLGQSDSSLGSGRKKEKVAGSKSKKHRDKNGDELVKDEDLDVLCDIGAGNGGTVTKVWNKKRNCIMARKVGWGVGLHGAAGLNCNHLTVAHPRRRQAVCAETDPARAADYERLQFAVYRRILWLFPVRRPCWYRHGTYGRRVS